MAKIMLQSEEVKDTTSLLIINGCPCVGDPHHRSQSLHDNCFTFNLACEWLFFLSKLGKLCLMLIKAQSGKGIWLETNHKRAE